MKTALTVVLLTSLAFSQAGITVFKKLDAKNSVTFFPGAAASATFTHIQGALDTSGTPRASCAPTFGGNMTVGNLIETTLVYLDTGSAPTSLSVQTSNGNVFTQTTHSYNAAIGGNTVQIYKWYDVFSGTPVNSLSISWTNNAVAGCWAEEYHRSSGSWTFDKDVVGTASTCTSSNANTPSISPTNSASLLTMVGVDTDNGMSHPTAGATLGVWTGGAGGVDVANTGGGTEYELSGTGSTAANFTCTGATDHYAGFGAAYF